MGTYNIALNTDDIKRSDEALKIEFVAVHDRLQSLGLPAPTSPEEMMGAQLHDYVRGLVKSRFDQPRLDKITAAMPTWSEQEIVDVAAAGHVDLTIEVPK